MMTVLAYQMFWRAIECSAAHNVLGATIRCDPVDELPTEWLSIHIQRLLHSGLVAHGVTAARDHAGAQYLRVGGSSAVQQAVCRRMS